MTNGHGQIYRKCQPSVCLNNVDILNPSPLFIRCLNNFFVRVCKKKRYHLVHCIPYDFLCTRKKLLYCLILNSLLSLNFEYTKFYINNVNALSIIQTSNAI